MSATGRQAASRVVAEATRRAGLVWLLLPSGPHPAWHVWRGEAAYVLTGGDEQPLPGLVHLDRVVVTVPSKENRSSLVSWLARCVPVVPGSAEWEAIVPDLVVARLNLPDPAHAPRRWARESAIVSLTPTGELADPPSSATGGAR